MLVETLLLAIGTLVTSAVVFWAARPVRAYSAFHV
jgi:hypothetical protein